MYFFRTFDPDQGGPNHKIDIFCQVGAILVKLCSPSWIYTLDPTWIHPTQTHALVGSIVTLVSMSNKFSLTAGGVPTPAMIFPLLGEDHVNNHISLGVPPPNTDTQTPCQVKVTPCNSEGIEPFTLVNSPPGQVKVSSSHSINSQSGQVGVTPHKSEDIEPFTLVNSPPGQGGVTPRNPGGIEP